MILSYTRTLFLYLVLLGVVRLMGKRQVGQMEPAEFVITMLAANLVSIPMQDGAIPLYTGLVPILTVLGAELVLSWLMLRSKTMRRILCGKPVILVENGAPIPENLRKTRVTLDELAGLLREKDILQLQTVQYAILETNGSLTVFPFPETQPPSAAEAGIPVRRQYLPVTLVEDGKLLAENLTIANVDRRWVDAQLRLRGTTISATLLLTLDAGGTVQWFRKEDAT